MDLRAAFASLSTPLIADACVRRGIPLRLAPPGIHPAFPGCRTAGRVLPAAHAGSVDVFLEAIEAGEPGDVLVVDNDGRTDEGCVGDLTALEAASAGLAGIVVWGFHRDGPELAAVRIPVFSYGTCPAGPVRVDARRADALTRARFGSHAVGESDAVFADADGALFVALERVAEVLEAASQLRSIEQRQAHEVAAGNSLREQLRFREYLERRRNDPRYTFRAHLRSIGGAIEE